MSTAVDRLRFARLARFSGLRIFTASSTGRVRALEPTAALIARMRQDVPMEQQKSLQPRRPKPSPRRGAQLRNLKERAAVLIGVQHYFNLPVLATSLDCVGMMRTWALSQGFQPERVVQLTDEREPVRITDVYYAIRKLLESQQIEQLFIYFAGYGINISRGEYWLLSDAPNRTDAAINVEASVALARYAGVAHVIFVSDTCRLTPEAIQAVSMRGGEIFPNEPVHERGQPVDLSLSRTVGSPAGENRDIALAVERFDGSYTRALVTGLSGQEVRIVEPSPTQKGFGFIYPRSLSRYLEEIWPRQARMGKAAIEGPETRISSGEDAWLAYVPLTQPSSGSRK